jgi:hypothetical protein
MEIEGKLRLSDIFVSIHDPRQSGKVRHDLVELLVVAVNAVLVGLTTFSRSSCGPRKSWIGCAVICGWSTVFLRTTPSDVCLD